MSPRRLLSSVTLLACVIGMVSSTIWAAPLRILPALHRVDLPSGATWAAYTLEEAKLLPALDEELFHLRELTGDQNRLIVELKAQIPLYERIAALEADKYKLIDQRFIEKSLELEKVIAERNKLKYERKWALGGSRTSFFTTLLMAVGVGFAISR